MKTKRSVVIVDDEKHVVNRLALGFDWEALGFQIVGAYTDSINASNQIPLINPDVVVSDIKMPGLTGLELMSKIKAVNNEIKFVFISGFADFKYAHEALKNGASGYCLKPLQDEELTEVLLQISKNLDEEELNLSLIIDNLLSSQNSSDGLLLMNRLQNIPFLTAPFYVLSSFGDISEELIHFVSFKRIAYDNNVFLYFVSSSPYIESFGFQSRIKQRLINGQIKSFCYSKVSNHANLGSIIAALIDSAYVEFISSSNKVWTSFALRRDKQKSDFYLSIEKAFGKRNIGEIMEALLDWEEKYPEEARSISEAIDIYNLVMTLIYQETDVYFKARISKPFELVNGFSNLSQMMQYLTELISNLIASDAGMNIESLKNETFKSIIEYINNNYADPITFQSVCMQFSITPSYLCQIFQKELNTTFTKYLTKLRIAKAKTLLTKTNQPIASISTDCGFDQYFYFARVFKKENGITPTQYREQNKPVGLEKYGIISDF